MPKIFVYCLQSDAWMGFIGYALAEDGHCLSSHVSSSVAWSYQDMIGSGWKVNDYLKHYPEGYELVWLANDPDREDFKHPDFEAAFAKNQALKRAEEALSTLPTVTVIE